MTNLKDINFGINQYCGPAVLSALTGKSTDECAGVISSINGRSVIKAISTDELIKALNKLRFDAKPQTVGVGSLYRTFSFLVKTDGMYVILIPRHVIAAEVVSGKIFLIDNHSKQPIDAAHSARLMQKVDAVYRVVKKSDPVLIESRIRLDNYIRVITIYRENIYEDIKDNVTVKLGSFSYKDESELNQIINQLIESKSNNS